MINEELKSLFGEQMRIIPTTKENAEKFLDGEKVNDILMGDNDVILIPDDTDEKIAEAKSEINNEIEILTRNDYALEQKDIDLSTQINEIKTTYATKDDLNNAMVGKVDYLGTVSSASGLSKTCGKGDFYRADVEFSFDGETAHVGDILIALVDNPQQQNLQCWDLIHTEIGGNGGAWVANSKTASGYVAKGEGQLNKVWGTDNYGNPQWKYATPYDTHLQWGGDVRTAPGPIDACLISEFGANRFAFMPLYYEEDGATKNVITFEYSRDGGSTWLNYEALDYSKKNLFNGLGATFRIGASEETGIDKTNYLVRITIDAYKAHVYCVFRKFAINVTTDSSSDCYCTIETRTQGNYLDNIDTWKTEVNRATVSGWSGWNIINGVNIITSPGRTDEGFINYSREIRFTFGVGSHPSTSSSKGLAVLSILGFSPAGAWNTPSSLAKRGTIYTYDSDQNVNFPAQVTATQFNGLASKAAADGNNNNIVNTYATKSELSVVEGKIPTNYVTTDTIQTISGEKTFTGIIRPKEIYSTGHFTIFDENNYAVFGASVYGGVNAKTCNLRGSGNTAVPTLVVEDGKTNIKHLDATSINAGSGTIETTGTVQGGSFNATSDRRLKENIKDYTPTNSILDLPIKEFNFIGKDEKYIGCIAQDLQELFPELVNEGSDGYLSIKETKLVYLLIKEVKELKEEIERLKKEG